MNFDTACNHMIQKGEHLSQNNSLNLEKSPA